MPRDAYRQMLFSAAELRMLSRSGALGRYRYAQVDRVMGKAGEGKFGDLGEAYVLGDSPLVTLTALQSPFQPDPSSSRYELLRTPRITDNGAYRPRSHGRPMRLYRSIDARLTFSDMVAKFAEVNAGNDQ